MSNHADTYASLAEAEENTQAAHYALEEGEYNSALQYIEAAQRALTFARSRIEPELR